MIITGKAVFLQLPKCASTSMQRLLKAKFEGQQYGKHSRLETAPTAETSGKPVVGGVRNPFAWYLSLWKFGCTQRGINWVCATAEKKPGHLPDAALKRLQHAGVPTNKLLLSNHLACEASRDRMLWQQIYSNPDDVAAFREWVKLIHQPEHRFVCFPEFGYTQYYQHAGLFSHVFSQLYRRCNDDVYNNQLSFSPNGLVTGILVRQENFSSDILQALSDTGHLIEPALKTAVLAAEKVNTTAGAKRLSDFYNAESRILIAQKDTAFIRAAQTDLSTLFYGPLEITDTPQGQ